MAEDDTPRTGRLDRTAPEGPPRRRYAKPHLIDYGSVTKLTQGTRTTGSDAPAAGFKMACL
ncbi:MAG: hypothetical protein M3545_19885 [Acidobacteriota bacterium]|nr:hypothetical protein [Acidobacteriota bacterium]